jgi:hypothetical protein
VPLLFAVEANVAHGEARDEAEERGAAGARGCPYAVLAFAAALGFGLADGLGAQLGSFADQCVAELFLNSQTFRRSHVPTPPPTVPCMLYPFLFFLLRAHSNDSATCSK